MQICRPVIYLITLIAFSYSLAKSLSQKSSAVNDSSKTSAFDSSTLVRANDESAKLSSSNENAKKKKLTIDLTSKEDPKKLDVQIKALNLIIKTERDRSKKVSLYLRKSYLHVSVAKMLGIKRNKDNVMSVTEKFHLDEARKILTFLLKSVNNDRKTLSTIYNILGLVEYESDNHAKTIENFIKSIDYDQKNAQSEVMTMYVAEYYFDNDDYERAIRFYNRLYSQMSPYQKALADYKTAWCYINLKDYARAEALFVKVIRNNYDKPIAEDSYKDLAFIITQKNDEQYSIDKSKELFSEKSIRAKFLYYNLLFFLQQSKNNPRELLFAETFAIQDDEYERIKVFVLKVAFEKKDYPNTSVYNAVLSVHKYMSTLKKEVLKKFLTSDSKQFEQDNEIIIRQFVDAYAGRLKVQEPLSKAELSKMLIELISIQLKWFPESQHFLVFYNLWVDTCVDTKNSKCLLDLEKDLLKRLSEKVEMKLALRRVQLEVLSLYDEAAQKDPAKHEKAFYFRLQDYEKNYPTDPQILKIDKKILSIDFKNKNFKEALSRSEKIYAAENNAQNLEKLFLTLFELRKYNQIASHPAIDLYKNKEIIDIRREVSLKLAQESSAAGQFNDYQKNVKAYLATAPNIEKSVIVQVDYLNQILNFQKFDLFVSEWKSLPPDIAARVEMNAVLLNAYNQLLNVGNFLNFEVLTVYRGDLELQFQTLLYRRSLRIQWTEEDMKVFNALPEVRQTYIYNLLAITDPFGTMNLLAQKRSLTELEKKALKLSLVLSKRDENFMLTEAEMKTYKNFVSADHWFDKEVPIEVQAKSIDFPKPDMKPEKYNSLVETRVKDVKYIRNKALKRIPELTRKQKMRLLRTLMTNENGMAAAILTSPVPQGLSPQQVQDYKAGLEEVSKEYSSQGLEFQKALSELEGQLLKEDDNLKAGLLPEIKVTQWALPAIAQSREAVNVFEKVSPSAALVYLDHEFEAKKISAENYLSLRAGLLLRIDNSSAIRRLIRDEFLAQQQQGLIEKWKKIK